jgi:hypothetical protein
MLHFQQQSTPNHTIRSCVKESLLTKAQPPSKPPGLSSSILLWPRAVIISAAHGARPLGILKHVNMATALSATPMELNAEAPDGSYVLYDEAAGALTTAAAAIDYSNEMPVNGCHAIDCENKSSIYGP